MIDHVYNNKNNNKAMISQLFGVDYIFFLLPLGSI